jgi:hypothetical protein
MNKNEIRPTPETDAEFSRIKTNQGIFVTDEARELSVFTRKLERERDEAREEIARLQTMAASVADVIAKRDAMLEAIREAHTALKAIDDLRNNDFPTGGDFSDTAIEAFNKGNITLTKLKTFIP